MRLDDPEARSIRQLTAEDFAYLAEKERQLSSAVKGEYWRRLRELGLRNISMNTTKDWIRISERAPIFPAWVSQAGDPLNPRLAYHSADCVGCTHWQPAVVPAPPPPKELTQAEKDKEAYTKWYRSLANVDLHTTGASDIWHAALAWERGQCEAAMQKWRESLDDRRLWQEVVRDFYKARSEGGGA